jgi:predicted nuclease of predicted toxin-antitoxin system
MRIYLDDDISRGLLATLLRKTGHDTQTPRDAGIPGAHDPVHLTHAIREDRVFLSQNYDDFKLLHDLLMAGHGHHAGILIVRKDNNPKRDLSPPGIVRAIRNLLASGFAIPDSYIFLNHYR